MLIIFGQLWVHKNHFLRAFEVNPQKRKDKKNICYNINNLFDIYINKILNVRQPNMITKYSTVLNSTFQLGWGTMDKERVFLFYFIYT